MRVRGRLKRIGPKKDVEPNASPNQPEKLIGYVSARFYYGNYHGIP